MLVSRTRTLVRAFPVRRRRPEVIFARVPPCFGLIMESDNPNAGATLSVSDLPPPLPIGLSSQKVMLFVSAVAETVFANLSVSSNIPSLRG